MIIISNKQRDDILRYIELMCQNMQGKDNRTFNTKRLAMILHRTLKQKQPVSKSDLPEQLKKSF